MNGKLLVTWAALAAALPAMGGCVNEPLSKPAPSDADKALFGKWQAAGGDHTAHQEFAPPTGDTPRTDLGDQKLMVMTSYNSKAQEGTSGPFALRVRRVFVTTVAGQEYLNAYTEKSNREVYWNESTGEVETGGYFDIERFRVTADTLEVWALDGKSAVASIEAKRVGGEVKYEADGKTPQAYVLDGGEGLRKVLAGPGGDDLFPESGKLVYKRVKGKK